MNLDIIAKKFEANELNLQSCPNCGSKSILGYIRHLDLNWDGQCENLNLPSKKVSVLIFGTKSLDDYGGDVIYTALNDSGNQAACGYCWKKTLKIN